MAERSVRAVLTIATMTRNSSRALVLLLLGCAAAAGILGGCSGDTGADGLNGAPGRGGPRDRAVMPEPKDRRDPRTRRARRTQGTAGPGRWRRRRRPVDQLACPLPRLHGLVEQWKTSTHYATYISNLGGEEVASWTGNTTCGNCHAIDGVEQRVAGNVNFVGTTGPVRPGPRPDQLALQHQQQGRGVDVRRRGRGRRRALHHLPRRERRQRPARHRRGLCARVLPAARPGRRGGASTHREELGPRRGRRHRGWRIQRRQRLHLVPQVAQGRHNYIARTNNLSSIHWGPHEGPQADIYSGKAATITLA